MSSQANVTPISPEPRNLRQARGAFVKAAIDDEERTARFVALRIGIAPSSMSERLKGKSPFLADELESIARVLRRDPIDFYRAYITVGTEKAPTPEGEGLKLPGLDSNQEPIG